MFLFCVESGTNYSRSATASAAGTAMQWRRGHCPGGEAGALEEPCVTARVLSAVAAGADLPLVLRRGLPFTLQLKERPA